MENQKTVKITTVWFWYFLMNLPLVAISVYAHYLLTAYGFVHGNDIAQNFGLWLLISFKFLGANMIMCTIFSEFKIS